MKNISEFFTGTELLDGKIFEAHPVRVDLRADTLYPRVHEGDNIGGEIVDWDLIYTIRVRLTDEEFKDLLNG